MLTLMKHTRTNFSTRCLLAGLKKAVGGMVATPCVISVIQSTVCISVVCIEYCVYQCCMYRVLCVSVLYVQSTVCM